ncbi:Z-ring formation inhibitor MciZ [Paenibacillus glycanilyticus]|uniref:Z-ring formation inhibitor MciZ n=1 Tax=Paenibacillus glycanilyticus TaxID=126569 RepID=A0ABQ6GHJ4_9BACL|nr:Z-ring formation inhibitor MciZ [Paenibacillus glycanilyticus]GLX69066.1 hypothetical protein MU1_34110 [Paenibacillus glycanilyticus]
MKQYLTHNELRLVGKAWEIQSQLRKLSNMDIPLHKLLKPQKAK